MLSRHFVLQGSWPPPLYSLSWPYGMVASPTLLAGLAAASPPPPGEEVTPSPPEFRQMGLVGWGGEVQKPRTRCQETIPLRIGNGVKRGLSN